MRLLQLYVTAIALATIKADRGSVSDCNKVYSEYRITNSSRMVINGEDNELFSSEAYDGKVTICYRFLSETNANFNGMSISCREQLIRDGILSTRVVEKQEHLPLNVSVIGARGSVYRYVFCAVQDGQSAVRL